MRTLTDHIVSGDQAVQLRVLVLDEPGSGNANHHYAIEYDTPDPEDPSGISHFTTRHEVRFQNGPIKECGVNGVTGEAHIAIEIDRLRGFQSGPYACNDNQEALEHFIAGLQCIQRRTLARIARGVEGTHAK